MAERIIHEDQHSFELGYALGEAFARGHLRPCSVHHDPARANNKTDPLPRWASGTEWEAWRRQWGGPYSTFLFTDDGGALPPRLPFVHVTRARRRSGRPSLVIEPSQAVVICITPSDHSSYVRAFLEAHVRVPAVEDGEQEQSVDDVSTESSADSHGKQEEREDEARACTTADDPTVQRI